MDELNAAKWLGRQVYRWSWKEPFHRRGFLFAVWWVTTLFAALNTAILFSTIDKAPGGAWVAVMFLWACSVLLRRRVNRNEQRRREAYHLPHRR